MAQVGLALWALLPPVSPWLLLTALSIFPPPRLSVLPIHLFVSLLTLRKNQVKPTHLPVGWAWHALEVPSFQGRGLRVLGAVPLTCLQPGPLASLPLCAQGLPGRWADKGLNLTSSDFFPPTPETSHGCGRLLLLPSILGSITRMGNEDFSWGEDARGRVSDPVTPQPGARVRVCVYMRACVCIFVRACVHVCMCVRVCVCGVCVREGRSSTVL